MWRSDSHALESFFVDLDASDFTTVVEAAEATITAGRSIDELTSAQLPLGPLDRVIAELDRNLRDGSGFAIVRGVPVGSLDDGIVERVFWALGLRLGDPVSQSVMGERLGHIVDVTDTDPHARAYRNRSELTPHTDPADYLSFLCLQPAASGGVSRFVSALAIHEEMRTTRPELLERLTRGFRYHRLGEQRPGSAAVTPHRVPVFSERDGLISCRYVRQYFEVAAHEDPSIVIDDVDREAIELFETLAADPSFHHEFTLATGEAVFANNFVVLHARSAFENAPDRPPRHLLRLWISARPPRPTVPRILHYDGEPGIPRVEGRTPSYDTEVDVQ